MANAFDHFFGVQYETLLNETLMGQAINKSYKPPEPPVNDEREKTAKYILDLQGYGRTPGERAEKAVTALYTYMGIPKPEIVWLDSPWHAVAHLDFSKKQAAQNLVFRHLQNFALSERRDSMVITRGEQEQRLLRVTTLVERELRADIFLGELTPLQRETIASLKYGPSWSGGRRYGEDNEWEILDPLFLELGKTTTGFILTATKAYLIRLPLRLELNDLGVLDYEAGMAIEWPDGHGVYALKGVVFGKEAYDKLMTHSMTAVESIGLVDTDQRRIAVGYLEPKAMIKALEAELVDEGIERHYKYYGRRIERVPSRGSKKVGSLADITISNKLYKTTYFSPKNTLNPMSFYARRSWEPKQRSFDTRYFLYYTDPSTGEDNISFVTQGVEEVGEDADAAMAWKQHSTKEEYVTMYLEA